MHRALALACVLLASAAGVDAQTLRERMLLAEDARPQTAEGLAPLMDGVKAAEPGLRRQAVRALGRLERPELVPAVAAALADAVPAVRREAFNALAQLAHTGAAAAEVQARILDAMPSERDATVWGTAAAALGRLAYAATRRS
jgi:HEAT repeat protein